MKKLKQKLGNLIKLNQLKNISFYFLASISKAFVSLLISPLMALNFTHLDYSILGFYASFEVLFMPFLSFMFVQYYNRNYFKKDRDERGRMASALMSAQLLFGLIELLLLFIGFQIYMRINNVSFPFYPYAILAFTTIVFNNLYTLYLAKTKLSRNAKKYLRIAITNLLISTSLALLFVVGLKLGALGRHLANFITAIVFGVISFKVFAKNFYFDKAIIKDAFYFCWPIIIASSLGYFFTGIDRSMLTKFDDSTQYGLYNIGLRVAGFIMIFQKSISQTFQPDVFEAVAKRNTKKLLKILLGINLFNIIPITLFIIFAPFILKILTADRYTDAYFFARIFAFRVLTSGIYYVVKDVITAYGFTKSILIIEILGSVLSVLLYKILINEYEFVGAAWGQVLTFLVLFIISLVFLFVLFHKKLDFKLTK